VVVRAAARGDAESIAAVHVRCWQQTYRGHFPQDFLDALDPAPREARYRDYLGAEADPRTGLFVSEVGGTIIGFINVGPCRDEDVPDAGEVRALYLLSDYWGQGLGRALMSTGLALLRSAGFFVATLWVLDANERARTFYEAGGWIPDGGRKQDDTLGFPVREVRYRRRLT
jgi:GNAT superfamily N-acetyltransferase